MKFGVREICDVVFKAKAATTIGNHTFKPGQPVLYIDTAKTSTMEGSGTTVYAQGGKGNARLMAWEGERALTFTVEDALLSPIGFSILSGAGLFKEKTDAKKVHVHTTARATVNDQGTIIIDSLKESETIDGTAPVFVAIVEDDGSITGELITGLTVNGKELTGAGDTYKNKNVFVDFYVLKAGNSVSEIQIDAATFGGYFYVEASTLFKDQESGKDLPAEITLPNVKIQSNFTFNMSSTGDPSTFSFVMDAFPGYTMFNKNKKVMCAMQILEDEIVSTTSHESVMKHPTGFEIAESADDSTTATGELN